MQSVRSTAPALRTTGSRLLSSSSAATGSAFQAAWEKTVGVVKPTGATTITKITAREVIDSRGNPTVEATVFTGNNKSFSASVPSGASTGIHEAVELRDGDKKRFLGKGVQKAVANVATISDALVAKKIDLTNQAEIDAFMIQLDGTPNLGRLGANALLGVSLAISRAAADAQNLPLFAYYSKLAGFGLDTDYVLPVPSFNVINGGSHAGNKLPIQEFMILPTGAPTFAEGMRYGCEVYQNLKVILKKKYGLDATNVGDEGGFAPAVQDADETVDLLMDAIKQSGYEGKFVLGLDVAASEWYRADSKKYDENFKFTPPRLLTSSEMVQKWVDMVKKYPIGSIEDPFDQDDWAAYPELTKAVGAKCQIVGDDLLVTNVSRIKTAGEKAACNALLCKPNQIGTVTQTLRAVQDSQKLGWGVMMSHRSGETEDNYIADMAVGFRCGQIKTGAPARSERLAKYNRLLDIEAHLTQIAKITGKGPVYAGANFRKPSAAIKA